LPQLVRVMWYMAYGLKVVSRTFQMQAYSIQSSKYCPDFIISV